MASQPEKESKIALWESSVGERGETPKPRGEIFSLWLQGGVFLLMAGVLSGAFLYSPVDFRLKESTRIMYFHVPMSVNAFVAFLLSALYGAGYLWKRRLDHDVRSSVSAEIGLFFAVLATVTGSVWSRYAWGKYWNWDPKQVTILLLILIYAAYFVLRMSVEGEERRAVLSSAYTLFAFVTVPFLMLIIPQAMDTLHPAVVRERQIEPQMMQVLLLSFLAFLSLMAWIYRLRVAVELQKLEQKESLL